jgi:hypothetical protein
MTHVTTSESANRALVNFSSVILNSKGVKKLLMSRNSTQSNVQLNLDTNLHIFCNPVSKFSDVNSILNLQFSSDILK